jgi:excisionase family DNA binding protein
MERLTVREVALRIGVSPATVRRMIAAGQLRAERESRPQGSRWIVLWSEELYVSVQASRLAHGTSPEPDALRVALETIADLRRRLDAAEEERTELRRLLAGALQALPPPQDQEPGPDTTMPRSAPETPEKPPARRPWWRRWFGG